MTKTEARRNLPTWMQPIARIVRRKDTLVAMDVASDCQTVYVSYDGGHSWDGGQFQTADFRHDITDALRHFCRQ